MISMATDGYTTSRVGRDEYDLLRRIAGMPWTPRQVELADQLGVSKSTICRRVAALVQAGLLRHANSRRGDLTLTPEGEKIVKKSSQPA